MDKKYYANIENNKLNGTSELNNALNWSDNYFQIKITKEMYDSINENRDKFVYLEGEVVENPEYEMLELQKEKERIARLHLTRGDVFRALLQAKNITRAQLRQMIENNSELDETAKEMALIDFDEALEFYRGVALIDTIGTALGISSKQMDEFFQTNDYTKLLNEGNNTNA